MIIDFHNVLNDYMYNDMCGRLDRQGKNRYQKLLEWQRLEMSWIHWDKE